MKDTKKTLAWIVGILQAHNVPFQITGGLAARSYGATRPIKDIDIEIPGSRMDEVAELVQPYIVWGPGHYIDERWDLGSQMMLKHEEQDIDICEAERVRICDVRSGAWVDAPTDLTKAEIRTVLGIQVPVILPADLIAYKQMLAGEHQEHDIAATRHFLENN